MNVRRYVNYFYAIIFFREIPMNGIQNFSSHIFAVSLMFFKFVDCVKLKISLIIEWIYRARNESYRYAREA